MQKTNKTTIMSDCSRHKKDLFGQTDMKLVAEAIGDLHYETLSQLLSDLAGKLLDDGIKDMNNERLKLGCLLMVAGKHLLNCHQEIESAWQISKPFMETPNQ